MIGEKVQLDTQKMEVATTITNSTGRGSHVQCIAPADDDTARFVFFWFRDAMISVIIVPLPKKRIEPATHLRVVASSDLRPSGQTSLR